MVISEQESNHFKLNIARSTAKDSLDLKEIQSFIFNNNIDVLRMKCSLADPSIFSTLEQLKIPYSPFSILVNQRISLKDLEPIEPKIEVRKYAIKDRAMFNDLCSIILRHDYNLYYKNEIYDTLFPKEKVIQGISAYHATFNSENSDNKMAFIGFVDNKPIGFCNMQINKAVAEAVYVGILPEYRSKNFFKEFVQTEILQAKLSNCTDFIVNTVVFNSRSLNTTLKKGLKIKDAFLNFNIFSLLACEIEKSIHFKSSINEIIEKALSLTKSFNCLASKTPVLSEIKFYNNLNLTDSVSWKLHPCFLNNTKVIFALYHSTDSYAYLIYDLN